MKKKLAGIILAIIVILGFLFRWQGIVDNHSFWADEAFISAIAKQFVQGRIGFFQTIRNPNYEWLHTLTIALFFKLFGISEFSARLPSVIFGSIGIIFAYLVARQFSNFGGGILAAFLYAFSQLNLANATQAKPYTAIQTLLLIIIYLLSLEKKTKKKLYLHLTIIFFLIVATLFHLIAILFWLIYFVYLYYQGRKKIFFYLKKPTVLVLTFFTLGIVAFPLGGFNLIKGFFQPYQGRFIITFNNTTYLRELLWHHYGLFFLPAIFGIVVSYKKNKPLIAGIATWLVTLLFMWNFRSYSHNIRYLVPFFGIIFVFFGVFWGEVGKKMLADRWGIVPLIVALLIFLGGYKVVRKPAHYYNPNADLYGDVQIADYKNMYAQLKQKFPEYKNMAIFNDLADTEYWYMGRHSNGYFMKFVKKPYRHGVNQVMIYGSLADFKKEMKKYPHGLVIVEDWQSFLPDDIKQYIKKNLKLAIKVDGLPQAQGDNWPLKVYRY